MHQVKFCAIAALRAILEGKRVKIAPLPHNERLCNSYFTCIFVQCVGLMARQLFHLPGRAVYGREEEQTKRKGPKPLDNSVKKL
ncbi:hypothetical protein [Escherichia phage rV5_ev147]|nr:hypothetical protein [Escherichia phage rV5_ev147]